MNPKFQVDFFTLIHDQEFVKWVNSPDPESDLHWNKFLLEHPECRKDWEDAVYIIKQLNRDGISFDKEAAGNLWKSIRKKTITKKRQIPLFRLLAAASILLVMGIGGVLIYQWKYSGESLIDYKSLAKVETTDNEVKLILSDQSEEVLNATEPEVKYNMKGEIEVNSQKRLEQKLESQKAGDEMLNQLVVPRGRRSNLVLSDGTRLWLNSGSRAVFPVVFTKKTREIYIEGEAYLDVAHDPSKPFYVVTDKIRVEVLGTKFNVSAYPDDFSTTVVLVEGSVQAIVGTKKLTMKPDHLLKYENSTGKTSLQIADVLMYTSWKDGWLNCYKESLETIATKLSRYYDRQIEFKDPRAKELTLTGKLDLKTECAEVFTAICSTAPISFEEKDNIFLISLTTLN